MAFTYQNNSAHGASATNPVTISFTPNTGSTVLVLMINTGSVARTGGSPTFNGVTLMQAGSTQTSAETTAEIWYTCDKSILIAGSGVSIPNSGAITLYTVVAAASCVGGCSLGNVTGISTQVSANPSLTITTNTNKNIIFATTGTGAQTWAPSAQTGTNIFNTDNGAFGDGQQYFIQSLAGAQAMGYTFGTSDDWCMVVASFSENPGYSNNYQHTDAADGISVTEKIK